ncbi:MAG: 50S ribosomal protein L24 [Candidatus Vogelbacteria bacterium RIFOXYD1_FULL_46_19]|uniref:Large ribosomal subunit protein uL24 n=1 Tax=Candidatus Vogelbacteria bacterium RIFOXYD1_FULL_46_19 TaxID=1802439 RepID=A0A1G2QGS8_9BACT|nr:MAG: 50S ribosomal protein L24 [Candidatus Vogelbacteria bacterium RIFOXYD1_FULL_46_19]
MNTLHIKKGDTVKVITGKDKGKTAKVIRAFPRQDKVIVEGLNLKSRRVRARKSNETGQTVKTAAPIHVSNLALAEKKTKAKPTKKAVAKK